MKTLTEIWPDFLRWVNEYSGGYKAGCIASYSREDMRYAYQAGYEKGVSETLTKGGIMPKEFIVGHGVRITESEDMGIFIHFESLSGNHTGKSLESCEAGHKWASEIFDEVEEVSNGE